jgi:P-loop Domain of unknown function (DUF2791)
MQTWAPGTRVRAGSLGSATVVHPTLRGALVELDRPAKMRIECPNESLVLLGAAPNVAAAGSRYPGPAQDSPGAIDPRRAIEALRFGVVPPTHVDQLTIGYDEFSAWVLARLPDTNDGFPQMSEVAGAFGTGKSHAMAVVREVAAHRGYLTTKVEVDGKTISLSDPSELLGALLPTITGESHNGDNPLVGLYSRAIEGLGGRVDPRIEACERIADNLGSTRVLRHDRSFDDIEPWLERLLSSDPSLTVTEFRWEVVQGNPVLADALAWNPNYRPRTLVSRLVVDRPTDFVKSLMGTAALARAAGLAGLVVTVDEFEVEHLLPRTKLDRVIALTFELVKYLDRRRSAQPWPLALFVASVGQQGHVGDGIIEAIVNSVGGGRYILSEWPLESLEVLGARISTLYGDAYGVGGIDSAAVTQAARERLTRADLSGSGLIRAFIKSIVAELDTRLGPPARA